MCPSPDSDVKVSKQIAKKGRGKLPPYVVFQSFVIINFVV